MSAPVVDENGACIGTIDLQDLISFLALASPLFLSPRSQQPIFLFFNLQSLMPGVPVDVAERNISMRTAGAIVHLSPRDTFTPLDMHDKCSLAASLFATGIHRCPLTDADNKLTGLLTQADLLVQLALCMQEGAAKAMGAKAIEDYGLGLALPVVVDREQQVKPTKQSPVHGWCLGGRYGVATGRLSSVGTARGGRQRFADWQLLGDRFDCKTRQENTAENIVNR